MAEVPDEPNVLLTSPAFHAGASAGCTRLLAPAERTAVVAVTMRETADQWYSAASERFDALPDRL